MKRPFFVIGLLFMGSMLLSAAEARLLHNPDVHQDQVVFVYARDLWITSTRGGVARKLTSHPGQERYPKFSPDGKWIAFTADYDGNTDIFVIPARGGEPRRITYHPGADLMLEWFPDGQSLLFRSMRASFWSRFNRLFRISVDGGYPEMLPLPTGELTSINSDGTKLAYNRMSRENRTWKRYRGGMTPNIWIYDLKENSLEEITPRDANDMFPMWHRDTIYYVSDRNEKKVMNIYAYDLASKQTERLTNYQEYDVQWPSIGPDAIVYENGGHLFVLDLETRAAQILTVEVNDDKIHSRPAWKSVGGFIHNSNISPTGKRAVFEARGDIFTVPAKKGEARNLTQTPGIRERSPAWSPDGKWIAYFSDRTGEYELYIQRSDGRGEVRRLTSDAEIYYDIPVWSPDSKKILFSDCGVNMSYVDIETRKVTRFEHGDHEGTSNFISGTWSPDSKWIAYSKASVNSLDSIYLYSLETGEIHKVTSDMTHDTSPAFDPGGKYLYFIANREHNYSFSALEFMHYHYNPGKVVVVTLQADTPSPFLPESDEEAVEDTKAADAKSPEEKDKPEAGSAKVQDIKVDIEGLESRIVNLPIPDGNYLGIGAYRDKIVYGSVGVPGSGAQGFDLHLFDMKKREAKKIIGGLRDASLSEDGKKALVRQGDNYAIIDLAPDQKPAEGRLNLAGLKMMVDPKAEWRQMYHEAWRLARDFFYDPNMHGVDWPTIKERYGQMLPFVAHRDDLNYLIGEMIAELNSSHTYRGGGEYPEVNRVGTGLLGCDLEPDKPGGYYRIAKIYSGQNWDPQRRGPLAQPGLNVKAGDYLIEMRGKEIRHPANPYAPLVDTVGKAITVKVNSLPTPEGAREIIVTPVGNELMLRYRDWVNANRKKVDEATKGRVGYLHLPATAAPGVEGFSRDFYPQVRKEALIIDVRYNSGGHIPDIYMAKLDRKLVGLWATRYTTGFLSPFAAHYGPKICIINSYAGSGGDAFPYFFKRLELGKLIGTRTWGGLIGLSGTPVLMDNGGVSIADFSFYNPEGEWDVENHGVDPDIEIDDRPDLMVAGHDPSLEKAIIVINEELNRLQTPPIPKPPKKNPIRK